MTVMSSNSEPVHLWYQCHHCGARPIEGTRYTCTACPVGPDNDLCENCYGRYLRGEISHPAEHSFGAALEIREHPFASSEGRPLGEYLPWLKVAHPAAADPPVPDGFVLRPELRCGDESYLASYAFAVEVPDEASPLVLTALHVMDELIKKKGVDATAANTGYTGRELPDLSTKVVLYDPFAERWILAEVGEAGPMLVLPDARTDDEEPFSHRDVAAFRARGRGGLVPGRLAARRPRVGDPVWLAARHEGAKGRTAKAVVVESTAETLVYRYEDPERPVRYSSGAPVLDREGAVVGVNAGGGWLEGRRLGHANHVESLRRHLERGLALASARGAEAPR